MIAIIAATYGEIKYFTSRIKKKKITEKDGMQVIEADLNKLSFVLIISGVGIKKAKNAAHLAITRFKPGIILATGFSGALQEDLKVGDILIGTAVVSLLNQDKIDLFSDIPKIPFYFRKGLLLSESSFASSSREKIELSERSEALAVDMETWGVAGVTSEHGARAVSCRVVSDALHHSLPRMEKLFNKNASLSIKKSLIYFLKNPFHLLPFLKFRYVKTRKARIRLSHFLLILLPALNELDC